MGEGEKGRKQKITEEEIDLHLNVMFLLLSFFFFFLTQCEISSFKLDKPE